MKDAAVGFEEAFGPLYRQARRVAWRLLGDQADAEDAAAEAMTRALVAWRKVGLLTYREAWVMRVTANVAIDVLRHRHPTRPTSIDEKVHLATLDVGDDVALGVDVRRALVRLSKRQREVLVLRYIGGLTEEEVTRCLGLSPSSVKTHAQRGLAQLRKQLGGQIDHVAF